MADYVKIKNFSSKGIIKKAIRVIHKVEGIYNTKKSYHL